MKGSAIVAVLSLLVLQTAADFGAWSGYGDCQCDLMQMRTRVCDSAPCIGAYEEYQGCACVPLVAAVDCPMVVGADSVYGIVADPCDCMNYYQCEFNATLGEFIAYQRTCNPCEIWDQDVLTCVWDPAKPDCRFFPSTEGIGICPLGVVVGNDRQFMLGNDTMDCAPGTRYNHTVCTCVRYEPYMIEMEVITSVSFDDVSAITAAKGLWLFNQNVVLSDVDCKSGRCGFFNSTAESKLELAYFSSAFDRFESFTARLFFKRLVGASGLKSLLDNSACDVPYSVLAESAPGNLNGGFRNSSGAASSFGGVSVTDGEWHQLVMVFYGNYVAFYIDLEDPIVETFYGRIDRVKAPLAIGGCICGGDCFFDGYMDSVCFLKGAADANYVSYLYNNPGMCAMIPQ